MCQSACPKVHPGVEQRWCPDCRREYERYLDEQGSLAALALEAQEFEAITPASDEEWRRHLEDIAPLVLT